MSNISLFNVTQNFDTIEDFFILDYVKQKKSLYWGKLAQIIQKFDQIMDIEKKQIHEMIGQIYDKKAKYLQAYIHFKLSLKTRGENKFDQYIIIQHQKIHKFFQKQLEEIIQIIVYFFKNPQKLSMILTLYQQKKKFNFHDFSLNLVNLIYSFYYIYEKFDKQSEFVRFSNATLLDWKYDIQNFRMKYNAVHNDILIATFKNPIAECFIEKIAIEFIKKLENSPAFIFDLQTIKKQIQSKKLTLKSFYLPEKKKGGLFSNLRFNLKSKTDQKVNYNDNATYVTTNSNDQNLEKQALAVQKIRHQQFIKIIKFTLDLILKYQLPPICKLLLRKFKIKIDREHNSKNTIEYSKHYCYLIMTNWILSQLHFKYTMSHDQKQMTNIQLQNISELLRAITLVFQQSESNYDKNLFYKSVINQYRDKVYEYYQQALQSDIFTISQSQISSYLISYEHCIKLFSFNDVRILCDMVKLAKKNEIQLDLSAKTFNFIDNNMSDIFKTKNRVKFRQKQYEAQNIYFMIKINQKQIINSITTFYLGKQYPLNQLPHLTQLLLKSSNLKIYDSLQISQSLQFLKKLDSKQIIRNLRKVQQNFENLKISQSIILNNQFQKSFQLKIKTNLINKSQLIRHKQNICTEIQNNINIIDIYIKKMKSQVFYQNVTNTFIKIAKINVYVGIQNDVLDVSRTFPSYAKKMNITSIIMSKKLNRQKQKQSLIKNNVLTESYKLFDNILKLIQWIAQVEPTKKSFFLGKKIQQFNHFFKKLCDIISQNIEQFIKSQRYLQHLDPNKFKNLVYQKVGQCLLAKIQNINTNMHKQQQIKNHHDFNMIIEKDKVFFKKLQLISQQQFYRTQLAQFGLQDFLFNESVVKFNQINSKSSPLQKLKHFDMLIKMIFSIISFTMPRQKITAQIINPIIQFVILKSKSKYCYKNLYIIQCLLGEEHVETNYILTLWDSALSYLSSMSTQYSQKK